MAFPGNSILSRLRKLPANVWSVSITSFFTDISSEMVINVLPLFLANVLGVQTALIGVIEGVAEATASLLKVFSGWLSDRIGGRKWLAVAGYGISALSKPFFYIANTWGLVAGVRWADRVGKGIRTAPRDALVADSIKPEQRGIAFGFHRAADTAGAMVGLLVAMLVIWLTQSNAQALSQHTFQIIVLVSLVPAFAGVAALALGTRDVAVKEKRAMPKFGFRSLGKPFMVFMVIVAIFDLGNSSDAFLVLRAQERGISVTGILLMLVMFNLVYTLISTPAGSLSDRIGRKRLIVGGWGLAWHSKPGTFGYCISSMGYIMAWLMAPARHLSLTWYLRSCAVQHTVLTMPYWVSSISLRQSLPVCCGKEPGDGKVLAPQRHFCLGLLWR
jgi:MFS family permease